ncbi:MAG: hypothetical protein JKX95_07500 [Bacteroidia bacterium]|nr:hypothetical protein [Bacteroidia bacterium]
MMRKVYLFALVLIWMSQLNAQDINNKKKNHPHFVFETSVGISPLEMYTSPGRVFNFFSYPFIGRLIYPIKDLRIGVGANRLMSLSIFKKNIRSGWNDPWLFIIMGVKLHETDVSLFSPFVEYGRTGLADYEDTYLNFGFHYAILKNGKELYRITPSMMFIDVSSMYFTVNFGKTINLTNYFNKDSTKQNSVFFDYIDVSTSFNFYTAADRFQYYYKGGRYDYGITPTRKIIPTTIKLIHSTGKNFNIGFGYQNEVIKNKELIFPIVQEYNAYLHMKSLFLTLEYDIYQFKKFNSSITIGGGHSLEFWELKFLDFGLIGYYQINDKMDLLVNPKLSLIFNGNDDKTPFYKYGIELGTRMNLNSIAKFNNTPNENDKLKSLGISIRYQYNTISQESIAFATDFRNAYRVLDRTIKHFEVFYEHSLINNHSVGIAHNKANHEPMDYWTNNDSDLKDFQIYYNYYALIQKNLQPSNTSNWIFPFIGFKIFYNHKNYTRDYYDWSGMNTYSTDGIITSKTNLIGAQIVPGLRKNFGKMHFDLGFDVNILSKVNGKYTHDSYEYDNLVLDSEEHISEELNEWVSSYKSGYLINEIFFKVGYKL